MDLKISGHSTALYSTFWMIDPLQLLFDCGDGAAAMLQQSGRKVKTIACSHADRDHLTGLPQFLQLNSANDRPTVLYPQDCGSFPAMKDFLHRFDPHVAENGSWQGIKNGSRISLKGGLVLEAFSNRHHEEKPGEKSLSFSIIEEKRKLRAAFTDLAGAQIRKAREEHGDDAVFEIERSNRLTYSADTPMESASFWRDPEILIQEATFLDAEEAVKRNQHARHSPLPEVLEMVREMTGLRALVLGHFSTRYDGDQICAEIQRLAREFELSVPIYAVLPGEFRRNILGGEPVWSPNDLH